MGAAERRRKRLRCKRLAACPDACWSLYAQNMSRSKEPSLERLKRTCRSPARGKSCAAVGHLRCQLPSSSCPAAHFPVLMGMEKQNLDSKRVGLLSLLAFSLGLWSLEACPQGHTLATSGRSAGSSTLPDGSYECSRHLTGCPSPCSKICTCPSQIGQTAALCWTKELLANTGHWHSAWSSSGPRVQRDAAAVKNFIEIVVWDFSFFATSLLSAWTCLPPSATSPTSSTSRSAIFLLALAKGF